MIFVMSLKCTSLCGDQNKGTNLSSGKNPIKENTFPGPALSSHGQVHKDSDTFIL